MREGVKYYAVPGHDGGYEALDHASAELVIDSQSVNAIFPGAYRTLHPVDRFNGVNESNRILPNLRLNTEH